MYLIVVIEFTLHIFSTGFQASYWEMAFTLVSIHVKSGE